MSNLVCYAPGSLISFEMTDQQTARHWDLGR